MSQTISIYSAQGVLKCAVQPLSNSIYRSELMTEEYVRLQFKSDNASLLSCGDYITYKDAQYKLIEVTKPTRSGNGYLYEQKFVAKWMEWQHRILFYDRGTGAEKSWKLTGGILQFLDIICTNLNTAGFGTFEGYADTDLLSEIKYIQFDSTDIISALNSIAQEWGTEWYIDGNYICMGRCELGDQITLKEGEAIQKITQQRAQDANYCTRLYAFGSERNLPANYHSTEGSIVAGVADNNLRLPNGMKYIDAREGMAAEEIVEGAAIFEDIYPRQTGTMASVTTKEYTDTDAETGTQTKWNAYRYTDSGLVFSKDYVLPNEELRIIFQSGNLAGMDFAVTFNPDGIADESKAAAQVFEIVRNEDYGTALPSDKYKPKAGDTYILYGYDTQYVADNLVSLAEQELLTTATAWLAEKVNDTSTYECQMNEIRCKGYNASGVYRSAYVVDLSVGAKVKMISSLYGTLESRVRAVEVRIDGLGRTYTIGKSAQYSRINSLSQEVNSVVALSGGGGSINLSEITRICENVLKSHDKEYLHSQKKDEAREIIRFDKGVHIGDYNDDDSILGAGGTMTVRNGAVHTTTDYLYVRRKAIFTEIEVHELKAVGGEIVISPAAMVCSSVTKITGGWKCYFENKDEDANGNTRQIYNEFRVGDLARCQTFNFDSEKGAARCKFYWRAVTEAGENYIVLSETDCADQSDAPEAGDNIVSLGNKTDSERQSAQILSAVGSDAPSTKHYSGINTYALSDSNLTFRVSPIGNRLTGVVNIQAGSTGSENLGITSGGDNLLRNTGFYGSVATVEVGANDQMEEGKEMYSPKLDMWTYSNAEAKKCSDSTFIQDSKSGFFCALNDGYIEQTTIASFADNDYILTMRGNGSIVMSYAGYSQVLTFGEGMKAVVRFKAANTGGVFRLQGTGYVCEIMLEKGVVASNEWTRSSLDTDPDIDKFRELNYLTSAIKEGATDIIGGLVLTNVIQVGNYVDKVMKEVTAGVSGVYNDDNDVAFWGGGTLAQAMKAVRMFRDDPTYTPTEEEWKAVANAVITHGGRAILNDAIFRGSVYAESGYFKGNVYAQGGYFNGEVNATSGTFTGEVNATSGTFTGSVHATDGEFHGKIDVSGGLVLSTKTIKVSTDKWLAGDCFLFVSIDSKDTFEKDDDNYPVIYFPDNPNEGSQYNVISNSAVGTIRLKISSTELAKGVKILDLRVQESIAMDMPERTTFVFSNNFWIVVNKYR